MSRKLSFAALAGVFAFGNTACSYDEGLLIENMVGTVVIPGDLVENSYDVNGTLQTIRDVRSIGPVYLGLYSGAVDAEIIETYPHPTVGPLFDASLRVGDTYPYGGTTIGTMRSTCLETLQCRTVSGRYKDYDEMIAWFRDYLNEPILDWYDEPINNGEELRQYCLTAFDFATDEELGMVASDTNGDDVVNADDLDFTLREDGNFEAEFNLWQQEYFANPEGDQGFTLWGMVDNASPGGADFDTCQKESQFGENIDQYNQDFDAGAMQRNVLNRPSQYLSAGDIVSGVQDQEGGDGTVGYIYDDVYDIPELWLNFQVQE